MADSLIKKRVKELNKSLGWLSEQTGIGRNYMAKLANGHVKDPRISTAMAIAGALRCQVEDLWPGERKET